MSHVNFEGNHCKYDTFQLWWVNLQPDRCSGTACEAAQTCRKYWFIEVCYLPSW